ncbi:MAG: hypothetical protein ACRCZF_09695 [Gemmataceae bacterium]
MTVSRARRGNATLWMVIVLACVTSLAAVTLSTLGSTRRQLDDEADYAQVAALEHSAWELCAALLVKDPTPKQDQTWSPSPRGSVQIQIRPGATEAQRAVTIELTWTMHTGKRLTRAFTRTATQQQKQWSWSTAVRK